MFFIPESTTVCYSDHDFFVQRFVGSTQNAGVWEVEDSDKQKYALKIFLSCCPFSERKKILERFTFLQNFQNLHLVPIQHFGFLPVHKEQPVIINQKWVSTKAEIQEDAVFFILSPYAKENLTTFLQEKQDMLDLLDYALQLCLGVRQLQRCYTKSPLGDLKPFFHGNLKPSNILFFSKGKKKVAKIADLGVEPSYQKDSPYLSPAQKDGKEEDFHCDVFALSRILQDMLPEASTAILNILESMQNQERSKKENLLGKLIETIWNERKSLEKKRRAHSYFLLGYNLWQQGHNKYALEDFTFAISLDPSLVEAFIYQGEAWKGLNNFEEALKSYNQAIALDGNNALAYENRAELYAEKELYDEAISDLKKAIDLNPEAASAYGLLGMVYSITGNPEKALEEFHRVISLFPDCTNAYIDRAETFIKTKQYDKAIMDYEKALSLDPENPEEIRNKIASLKTQKEVI